MTNLEKKIEERKKQALSQNILEKAKTITEFLGEPYLESCHVGGGGLSGDGYTTYKKGLRFQNRKLKIETYKLDCNRQEQDYVDIYLKRGIFFVSYLHVYSQSQADQKIEITKFREEDKWLESFNILHKKAVKLIEEVKDRQDKLEQERERSLKEKLEENFGIL